MFSTHNTGMPVVPFVGFGSSDGKLRNVDDDVNEVTLPSPPLQFGSATFTSAFVSDLMSDSFFNLLKPSNTCMHVYTSSFCSHTDKQ